MKKIFLLFSILLPTVLSAQITETESQLREKQADTLMGWDTGGVLRINFTQSSFTNWAAGGQNSLSLNGLFSTFANYRDERKTWENSLDIGYGILKQGSRSDFIKTDDKFDLASKFGLEAAEHLYYAFLLNFKTQFSVGRDYKGDTSKISNLLAPGYIFAALGLDYKPSEYFSAFVAPATGKFTLVTDQELANQGKFGVEGATYNESGALIEEGKNAKSELGGYIRIVFTKDDFEWEILQDVSVKSKLDLFSNYLKNPQNIDVNWETQLVFSINEYLAVTFNTQLLYDDDINIKFDTDDDGDIDREHPATQFKEILGIGFTLNL